MPRVVTREERIQRLVAKTRKRVDANSDGSRSLSQAPDSLLGTLVREAGYERSSTKLLETLEQSFLDAGIATYPEITDPGNSAKTRIHFFDRHKRDPRLQKPRHLFAEEKELSRFLMANKDVLRYCKANKLEIRGQEVRIAGDCRIDLLAVDTITRDLVGFELKASSADERIVAQSAKYMKALKAQAVKEGRPGARLLIVTGQPDVVLADLVQDAAKKHGVETCWLLYKVTIDLVEAV